MKILIFYAAYGGGHLSAANAIKQEIEKNYPENEIEMIDCMEYLSKVVNYLTVKSYEQMAKKVPKAWGVIYKASRHGPVAKISNSSNRLFAGKLGKLINRINPDLIISTHPFSTQMCGVLKKRGKINIPISTVLTDFRYHEQWLVKHEYIDNFFVSNENMKKDLINYGVAENKIYVTGFPISPKFSEKFNREEVLKEFDLKDNMKTILLFAGGKMGLARKNIFEILEDLTLISDKVQTVAISGKNEKIYNKFIEIAKNYENVKILEYTNKIPELESVTDLVITKPGGATASECIASCTPIFIINPIPGQEKENADYLEKNELAFWLKEGEKFEDKIKEALKSENLNKIKDNMKKIHNVNSTEKICKIIFEDKK